MMTSFQNVDLASGFWILFSVFPDLRKEAIDKNSNENRPIVSLAATRNYQPTLFQRNKQGQIL